ncbi:hypothetical protein ANCDUO_11543 [Ancylostoma duodenale]|uniref:Lipid-binding serum glycoprotein C-terminal domain-containing protein n=1 Tax=Ancylostoma duodenale TaxID=51022 RepID=A0A0C2CNG4_9BILA|nr:hypothetical protein ANCDUO_11543 [Ancylostoma duodenale]
MKIAMRTPKNLMGDTDVSKILSDDQYTRVMLTTLIPLKISHVEAEASAEVVYGAQSCHPAKIDEWTEAGLVPKMTVVWMSESVPNCLLSSAHEGKLVKFTVSKDIPSIAPYLRTSCSMLSICIGRFFKKLRTDYPDQYIDLNFHTYDAPFVRMRKEGIRINTTFAIDFHVHPMKEHPKSLARLVLGSSSSVIPEIIDNRLTGNLTDTHIDVFEHVREDIRHDESSDGGVDSS